MRRVALLGLSAVFLGASAPAAAQSVTITITDLRSSEGVVRACMTTVEDIFPR